MGPASPARRTDYWQTRRLASAGCGRRRAGPLQYRIAPVAKSDYDYLLLDTAGANTTALAQRLNKALGQ